MKKKIIIIISILFPLLFIKIPKYKELNNLIIVETIEVKCKNNGYSVELKEILPQKEDNSIKYEYKKYKDEGKNLKNVKKSIEKKTQKKFYYGKTQYIITNCSNEDEILKVFNLKQKRIIN